MYKGHRQAVYAWSVESYSDVSSYRWWKINWNFISFRIYLSENLTFGNISDYRFLWFCWAMPNNIRTIHMVYSFDLVHWPSWFRHPRWRWKLNWFNLLIISKGCFVDWHTESLYCVYFCKNTNKTFCTDVTLCMLTFDKGENINKT